MSGYASTWGLSRIQAGVNDVVYVPRDVRPGRRLVVLAHGYLGTSEAWLDASNAVNSNSLAHQFAGAGLTVAAVDFGNTWGNATATARVEACRVWAAANLGTASDKVVMVGESMGNLTALGYRRDYPTRVAGIVGIIPASDLNDLRVSNPYGTSRGSIDAAWGVTYPAALPTGADPTTNAAALNGVPWSAYYSTGDTVVPPATVTNLATLLGGTATTAGNAAHGDAVVASVPPATVAQQLVAWGA